MSHPLPAPSNRAVPRRFRITFVAVACMAGAGLSACQRAPVAGLPVPEKRRVIALSIDSFNEERIRSSLPPASTAAMRAVLDGGACAAAARPAFPSLTAPGHAALWTGAYGDVSGISGNVQPLLPRDAHTLTQTGRGFSATALRAEPLWITAALRGVRTAGHHTTQSPGAPAYPAVDSGDDDPRLAAWRRRADSAVTSPVLHLVNGYDAKVSAAQVLTQATHPLRAAPPWDGLPTLVTTGAAVPPRELVIPIGTQGDSLFVLFAGPGGTYDRALVASARDVRRATELRPHLVDSAPVAGRELARRFAPVDFVASGRRGRTHVRLFELTPDASRYMIFVPDIAVIASNHESTRSGYEAGANGWVGNSASALLSRGAFGPTLSQGGDGTAEQRWLETAELATRQSIAGAQWMWRALAPQVLLDYFALGDDTDHLFWGLVSPEAPAFDAALARQVQRIRAHAWSLVDARVGAVAELARESGATLFVSGDHGMRPYWRIFRPNVALAAAGLLAVDAAGNVDHSRSRALSPNGYWVSVNRRAWRGGTVAPHEESAVIDSVVHVLRAVRGTDGQPVVTRIFRASEHDSLGLGGPVGGDVYYELASGYYYNAAASGALTTETRTRGGHGYPSVSADMQTVLCAYGAEFVPRRVGAARTIDLAPTVLEWIGVEPAASVRGRSLLDVFR